MRSYATKQGETWDIVSYRCYGGDEGFVGQLIAGNPAHASTVIFPAGVLLEIPEVAAKSSTTNLPPWRTEA